MPVTHWEPSRPSPIVERVGAHAPQYCTVLVTTQLLVARFARSVFGVQAYFYLPTFLPARSTTCLLCHSHLTAFNSHLFPSDLTDYLHQVIHPFALVS